MASAVDGSIKISTKLDTENFQKSIGKLKSVAQKGMQAVAVSIGAVGAAFGAAAKVGMDFEAAMSEVKAISGATGDDLTALTEKAKQMGIDTAFSASEAAEAMKYMAMAGWKTEDMLNGIGGVMNLAAASGENLGTVSDIVTDALTAFGLQAKDSAHFADVLAAASSNANTNVSMMGGTFQYVAPVAGAMGFSIEDTAQAIGLMANAGIKAEKAGTALRSIFTRLTGDNKNAAEAMDALNLRVTNADGSFKSLGEIMADLRKKFANLTAEQKTHYATMLGGQEAMSGLLAIVEAAPADFDKLAKAIKNADGTAQEMADTMLDNLKGKITLIKSSLEGLGIAIYDGIKEPLTNAAQAGIDSINALTEKFKVAFETGGIQGMISALGDMVADMATQIASYAPQFVDAAITLINSLLIGIQRNTPKLVTAVVEIYNSLLEVVPNLLPRVADAGAELLESLMTNLPEMIQRVSAVMPEVVSALVVKAAELTPELVKAGGNLLVSLVNDLPNIINNIVSKLPEIVTMIVTGFIQQQEQLAIAGVKLFAALVANLPAIMFSLYKVGPYILKGIIDGIMQEAQRLWNAGLELINNLIGGAAQAAQEIGTAAGTWFSGIKDAATVAISNTLQAFADGWESIKTFFVNVVPELITNIGIWLNELPGKMGEALGYAIGTIARWSVDLYENGTEAAKNCVTAIIDWFAELPENLWTWLIDTIGKVKQWGTETYQAGVNAASDCINAIVGWFAELPGKIWSWLSSTLDKIREWGSNLISWAQTTIPSVVENIRSYFAELPSKMIQIGKDLIEGLWNGITSMVTWIKDKILDFGKGVINGFKESFDEHSPSKETQKIGAYLSEGLMLGIEDGAKSVESAIDSLAKQTIDTAKNRIDRENPQKIGKDNIGMPLIDGMAVGIRENSWEVSKEFEKLMNSLDLQRDMGVISEAEYYQQMESYRDGYLERGTKEWWDYTKKIVSYEQEIVEEQKKSITDLYTAAAEAAKKSIDEIAKAQESLASKLKGYGELYETTTTVFKGQGRGLYMEDGVYKREDDRVVTTTKLRDLKPDIQALEDYRDALLAIKERGTPDELFGIISDMSIEDASVFAKALIDATDEEYAAYIADWQAKQDIADQISREIIPVESDKIKDAITQSLEEAGYEVPEGFYNIGADSAQSMGEGFMAQLDGIFKSMTTAVNAKMQEFTSAMSIKLAAAGAAGGTVVTNHDVAYNFYSSNATPAQQIQAARAASEVDRMRGI